MTAIKNHFANNLRKLRLKRGTQKKVADDLIMTRGALGSYEEGRAEPSLNKLISMSKYFGVTIDQLLTERI